MHTIEDKFAWLDKWPNIKAQLSVILLGLKRR